MDAFAAEALATCRNVAEDCAPYKDDAPRESPDAPCAASCERSADASIAEDMRRFHNMGFLENLLADKTTRRRIIWATDTYRDFGPGFNRMDEIEPENLLARLDELLKTRFGKRGERTRRHGEVFTPLWVCEKMCAYAENVLAGEDWRKYVEAAVLEICCGEAPFLASRRDLQNGEFVPVPKRIGLLDRKIRVINENIQEKDLWLQWVFKAFASAYGYEFQGDNLLLARINMLRTFEEYLAHAWNITPSPEDYKRILQIISWNIWQMDGLTGAPPYAAKKKSDQGKLLGEPHGENAARPCLIRDWKTGEVVEYLSLAGGMQGGR